MKPIKVTNKGSTQALLPSRKAMKMLGANPLSNMGNYAKMTPSGNSGMFAPDVLEQSLRGPQVVPALPSNPADE